MGRTSCALLAMMIALMLSASASTEGSRASLGVDDLALLKAHNTSAHLLALWRLGQPQAAAQITAEEAAELLSAARGDADWRMRWLSAEALAQARRAYHPQLKPEGMRFQAGQYVPPLPESYSLGRLLLDDCLFIREAAARELNAEQPDAKSGINGLEHALGDESQTVRDLATAYCARVIAANPHAIRELLSLYASADDYEYHKSEDYLKSQVEQGQADAEAGRALLAGHDAELRRRQHQIGLAFTQAGAAAMPELRELWNEQRERRGKILSLWRYIGPQAASAADSLAWVVADPGNPLHFDAHWTVETIAPQGNLKLADALLPQVFAAGQSENPTGRSIDAFKALGPLPEPYVDQVITQIKAGVDNRYHSLIDVLGSTGLQSPAALDCLKTLAQDQAVDEGRRGAALNALEAMGLQGNLDAIRCVLDITQGDDKQRGSVVAALVHKGSGQIGTRFVRFKPEIVQYPKAVAMLADAVGAADLALLEPDLLEIPEFNSQVRAAIVAQIADPKTYPGWILSLTPLLARIDPRLGELGDALAAQFENAGSISDYGKALAKLNPQRARELYLQHRDDQDQASKWRAHSVLDGLGAGADPLLPELAARLVGEKTPGEWRPWLEYPVTVKGIQQTRPGLKNDLDPYCRSELAQAIGGCGADAAPYAPYLLWALKQAYCEREWQTVPIAVLGRPEQLRQAIDRSQNPYNDLIQALTAALAALGPEAGSTVAAAAVGQFNDEYQLMGSAAYYNNPEHDQLLRLAALNVLGGLGRGGGSSPDTDRIIRMLVSELDGQSAWSPWSTQENSELSRQRRIAAATALGNLGVASDVVVMALLKLAQSSDQDIRTACVAALRKLAGWEYPDIPKN